MLYLFILTLIFAIAFWIWSIGCGFHYPWMLAGVTLAAEDKRVGERKKQKNGIEIAVVSEK